MTYVRPLALATFAIVAATIGATSAQAQVYPPGSYPRPPGYTGYDERRERCEELWHREHELRERLERTPWGPERERLEYRLHETYEHRERLGCGH
jgi:hypothetical protein